MIIIVAILFFALVPGVIVSVPSRGSRMIITLVHTLIFALVFYIIGSFVFSALEGFESSLSFAGTPVDACPPHSSPAGIVCLCDIGYTLRNMKCVPDLM